MMTLMKNLTVTPVAISVKRNELLQMCQDAGETIRTFLSRVKGKAVTCRFKVECTHNHAAATGATEPPAHVYVNYTNEMIRHVILNGLYDDEIRRDIFGQHNLDTMDVNDLIMMIESRETARDATSSSSANAISQFKRRQKEDSRVSNEYNRKEKCNTCGTLFKVFKKMQNGNYNKKAFVDCQDCWNNNNRSSSKSQKKQEDMYSKDAGAVSFEISVIDNDKSNWSINSMIVGATSENSHIDHNKKEVVLSHHVFKDGNWRSKVAQPHPTVELNVSTTVSDYEGFGFPYPAINKHHITAIVDSGAQCCLWGWNDCRAAGFTRKDLIPVKQKLNAVSKSRLTIYGAVILRMTGIDSSGEEFASAALVYVSSNVSGFYLSQEAMIQLKIVPANFPSVGGAVKMDKPTVNQHSMDINAAIEKGSKMEGKNEPVCMCPRRTKTPGRPDKFPMEAIPENVEEMKKWLLNRYASSTFNTCPHQVLPEMTGPPMELHVDPEAKPVAARMPAKCPIHWEEQVKEDLKKDEALGVIEKVPHGEPSAWCHRMVITRKEDGKPRRTVDMSPLNKHCVREIHAGRSPFEMAKGVPAKTWRTVTDAKSSFHAVPIRKEDRHFTTFLSLDGQRYRYLRAPQGCAPSNDGHNRRFDEILDDFERKKRCCDDTLHYDADEEIKEH